LRPWLRSNAAPRLNQEYAHSLVSLRFHLKVDFPAPDQDL
jgi:hypothetical protein